MEKNIPCHIHEHSRIAWLAARKLRSPRMAVTLGSHIYLWNADKRMFLEDEAWTRHELCHVLQFRRYGFFRFLCLYMVESLRSGYAGNKFEIEAREAEQAPPPGKAPFV